MVNSFENLVIKIGGNEIYCSNANLNVNVGITTVFSTESKYAFKHAPENGSKGQLNFSYYLAGADPIYSYVIDENLPIPFELAGLSVNSGHLTSYGFSVEGDDPMLIEATIEFYEKVKGSFVTGEVTLPETEFLNGVNVSLSNGDYISHNDLEDLSYSYSIGFSPNYVFEETASHEEVAAKSVVAGKKSVSLSFGSYKHDLDLPTTGKFESVRIDLEDRDNVMVDSYYAQGVITEKKISIGAGERMKHSYELSQGHLGGVPPTLSSLSDTTVDVGDSVTVAGTNLGDIDYLTYLGLPCEITSSSSTSLTFKVPDNAYLSGVGPVLITTKAGRSRSLVSMTVTGDVTAGTRAVPLF